MIPIRVTAEAPEYWILWNLDLPKYQGTGEIFSLYRTALFWCEIHKEGLIKGLMIPMGTELNNLTNN